MIWLLQRCTGTNGCSLHLHQVWQQQLHHLSLFLVVQLLMYAVPGSHCVLILHMHCCWCHTCASAVSRRIVARLSGG
jgi:hypothetical protein